MRRLVVVVPVALAAATTAVMPVTTARASVDARSSDPVVTISTNCGGSQFCFTPATLTITDGDTVTWTDQSGTEHLVYRCDPGSCNGESGGSGTDSGFTSGDIPADGSFSHAFHGAGTYAYFCAIHGFATMHGVIVVTAAPATSTATTVTSPPTTALGSGTTGVSPTSAPGPAATVANPVQLAHTGGSTSRGLAVAIAALVLGFAAAATRRRRRA